MSNWISVESGDLPEIDQEVLIYMPKREYNYRNNILIGWRDSTNWYSVMAGDEEILKVTHWMQLPKKPNEEPNVQASVATKVDSSTSDGKQNNSSNSGEQQPVTGNLFLFLRFLQENDWHWEEDSLMGEIWYQETDSGKSEVLNNAGLIERFKESQPPTPGNVDDTDVIVDRLLDKITPEMQERIDKEMAEEKKKWEAGNVVTGELYWKQRCLASEEIYRLLNLGLVHSKEYLVWEKLKNQEVEPER